MSRHINLVSSRPALLQVLPDLEPGAAARDSIEVAKALVEEGWTAVVASAGGSLEREVVGFGAIHETMPLERGNPLRMAANVPRLVRLARTHKVEAIHARAPVAAWPAGFAARRAEAAFLTTFDRLYPGVERRLKKRFNSVMTAGDRVIVASDFLAEHIAGHYSVAPARIRVIRRGVDLAAFDPSMVRGHRIAVLSEKWHLGYDMKQVMVPGEVVDGKGHATLLEAMARLERRDFNLLVVGAVDPESGHVRALGKRAGELGLEERVKFVGHCDDMPAAFMLADVVVLPRTSEDGIGRAAIEAQAMGRPVIASSVGSLAETVQPASTGWLVPPNDAGELAWALDLALSLEDEVKERLAHRARAFVEDVFSATEMARRTIDVYRELVRRAPPPAPRPRPGTRTLSEVG